MLTLKKMLPVGDAVTTPFTGGVIKHPNLWLWDSWVVQMGDETNLYCLAIPRFEEDGTPITPGQRNDYYFQMRRFASTDFGQTWHDKGCVLQPNNLEDGSDFGNVWSGGVYKLDDGRVLYGYTGLAANSADHQFVQSICFAIGDENGPDTFPAGAISDPIRDREEIIEMGYYLPPASEIGSNDGEEGGPITAWRDPYMIKDSDGTVYAFWSAKCTNTIPSVAYAKLDVKGEDLSFQLMPPIRIPDDHDYTQAEVPKVIKDEASGTYYMMISTCNRLHEKQPDSEISKELRLYKSQSLAGPWTSYRDGSPIIEGMTNLFGASFMGADFSKNEIYIIAPYTELASDDIMLTFAPVQTVKI